MATDPGNMKPERASQPDATQSRVRGSSGRLEHESWCSLWLARGPGLVLWVLLTSPMLMLWYADASWTGQYEESLGYRFFYSLRQVFDSDPYVFLPQGHLVDLANQGLQILLNQHPPTQAPDAAVLDRFARYTVTIAHIGAVFAFVFAVRPLPLSFRWGAVLIAATPYFIRSIYGFNVITQPDYQPWLITGLLLIAGLTIRRLRALPTKPAMTWAEVTSLGAATSVCFSIKSTLLIYPVCYGLLVLFTGPVSVTIIIRLSIAWLLAAGGSLVILGLNYHGNLAHLERFLSDYQSFGSSVRASSDYLAWLTEVMTSAPWPVRVATVLPVILLSSALALRRQWRAAGLMTALLGGSLLVHLFLFLRYQPVTWFEASLFVVFALIVALGALDSPASQRGASRLLLGLSFTALAQIVLGLVFIQQTFVPALRRMTEGQRKVEASLATVHGKIAFLIPDNSYRPLTIDSAIWKGGSNILDGNEFGASPLMRSLYPARDYFSRPADHYAQIPLDLSAYEAVVFTHAVQAAAPTEGARKQMEQHYATSLDSHVLGTSTRIGSQNVLVWFRR